VEVPKSVAKAGAKKDTESKVIKIVLATGPRLRSTRGDSFNMKLYSIFCIPNSSKVDENITSYPTGS